MLLAQTALPGALTAAEALETSNAFAVADYFRLQRIAELALSSDGNWLAYVTTSATLEKNARERSVYVRRLRPLDAPTKPDAIIGATDLAWVPRTHELAFLSERDGITQVSAFDVEGRKVRQLTHSELPVETFRHAPDGRTLAFLVRAASRPDKSLYERFRHDESGILIDAATTSSHDFLNPNWHGQVHRTPPELHVMTANGYERRVPIPGDPSDADDSFHWSGNGRSLSVVYVSSAMPAAQLRDERTSLGVYALDANAFEVLADAAPPQGAQPGRRYTGGEWLPDSRKLLVRRVEETDPWVSESQVELALVDPFKRLQDTVKWRPLEVYTRGLKFTPVASGTTLFENTEQGVHSLFKLAPDGLRRSEIVAGLDGSSSQVRFSSDFGAAAFVNESLVRPPEIYLWRRNAGTQRLSDFNRELERRVRYRAREVQWHSIDGTSIKGWLLEPPAPSGRRPWPLVTHVHGGPAFAFPDAFAAYFDYWPYPFEALAERGIAVFFPNYRGTQSYGRKIASAENNQAVDDVVAGVRMLVADGTADPQRLALTGHSHGAIVGPQAMGQAKMFRAASFAEGSANSVVMYELMSEQANREIHDPILGASLYDSPQRYIDDSPDLHLAGVATASLFEGGAYTAALHMLGYPKALRRAGAPTEFIVYPQTQHNLATPHLQRESAARNLDWFEFWLDDAEDPDPAKEAQYQRWREQRRSGVAAPQPDSPTSSAATQTFESSRF